MLKTKVKFIVAFAIIFIAMCLLNMNSVKATNDTKLKAIITEPISDNIYFNTETEYDINGNNKINISFDLKQFDIYNFSKDTKKLDSLVKDDGYIYQTVYIEIPDNITEVTLKDNNTKLNIIKIDNVKYFEYNMRVLKKVEDIYIPTYSDNGTTEGVINTIQYKENSNIIFEKQILIGCYQFEGEGYNSWLEIVDENNNFIGNDKYDFNGKTGSGWLGGSTTAVYTAYDYYGDYYKLSLSVNVGDSITIDEIGTLTYVGTEKSFLDNETTMYIYKKKITDPSLLSKAKEHCFMFEVVDKNTNKGAYNIVYLSVIGETRQTYTVNDESKNIGISLNGATDVGVSLKADTINENDNTYIEMKNSISNNNNYIWISAYDIKLIGGNYEGELAITFDLGLENSGKTVYIAHKKSDGSFEYFKSVVENGKVTIKVDELSPFLIGYETTDNNKVENDIPEETIKDEKDDTPKTGITININILLISVIILSSIGAIAIAIIKKYK